MPRSNRLFFAFSLISFLLDRVTKIAALKLLAGGGYAVAPGFNFELAVNTGISFSLFASQTGTTSWFITATVALVVALLVVLWRFTASTWVSNCAYGLIVGGAVSNFLDRLYIGGVVDFIDLFYGVWHWPTFNIADVAIVVGFILLLWETLYAETSG